MSEHLLSRVKACLLGVQIGDGMGAPWEILTHQQILAATDGAGVLGFFEPKKRKLKDTRNLPLGGTTDDWAFSRAVARSLVRCRGYDSYDQAVEQLREFEAGEYGWGGTTRRAFVEIKAFFDSRGVCGRSPIAAPPLARGQNGAGNGVAMKIAPLGLWQAMKPSSDQEFLRQVLEFGLMTHPNPLATAAAFALASMIADLCNAPLICDAQKLQKIYNLQADLFVFNRARSEYKDAVDLLRDRLIIIAENINNLDEADWPREKLGTGCYAPESVMFAIATFLRHPADFRAGLLEAINAGGDTDSTASMVGALIGANCGLADKNGNPVIPPGWQNFLLEYRESLELGEKLFFAAQSVK